MQFTQIALDERMRELTQHGAGDFPIQFYIDELFRFPGQCIPLHWHPELELWQARGGDVTGAARHRKPDAGRRLGGFHQRRCAAQLPPGRRRAGARLPERRLSR